ncbi:MAG: aminotransferase class I/II-fold pyridoxal phosphate-dependent enzyme, partial [Planctomycetales bacterium]
MAVTFSDFAANIQVETAFSVLAVAKTLIAAGKQVIELEIGDSPFPSTANAKQAGIQAIEQDRTRYCASGGLPEFRQAVAEFVNAEMQIDVGPENVVAGHGAKIFELLFCEAFLNPGDGVLLFSPYVPTYPPNIARRGARITLSALKQSHAFRPNLEDVENFLRDDPNPKAI